MVPYAQMRERGFDLHDGGEPISCGRIGWWK
jgi:hypothetical protein